MRPVLMPANVIAAQFRARVEEQLASLSVELVQSRGPFLGEPLAAAAIDWATALTATTLPEEHGYPALYSALSALLDAICSAPSARGWVEALARYELLLLAELGFGLALDECVVSGASEDLAFVSPKSGAAVSRTSGSGYADRLFVLPPFLIGSARTTGDGPDWPDLFAALNLTGHFIERHFFADHRRDVLACRRLLLERLKRVVA
jgi:DNA repair protein RecO (recombination protein O)